MNLSKSEDKSLLESWLSYPRRICNYFTLSNDVSL